MSDTPISRRNFRSTVLDNEIKKPIADWSANLSTVIISNLQAALQVPDKEPLEDVSQQLSDILQKAVSQLPAEVREGIFGHESPHMRLAFLLGQLSFAQQMTSQVLRRRPSSEFYACFEEGAYKVLLAVLCKGASTKKELSAQAAQSLEEVHSNLRNLTALGVVDFRVRTFNNPDNETEYFLTLAASHMLKVSN